MTRKLGVSKAGALAAAALFCAASPAIAKGAAGGGAVTWTSYEAAPSFQSCSNLAAATVCDAFGAADGSGLLSALSRLEAPLVAAAPDERTGTGASAQAGGGVAVTHSVARRTRSVLYSVSVEVVPYDDPTTVPVEQSGIASASENLGAASVRADLWVDPPGCAVQACRLHAERTLAAGEDIDDTSGQVGDALNPDPYRRGDISNIIELADFSGYASVGTTATLEVTLVAPAGTYLPQGQATVLVELGAFASITQLPGSSAQASGALRVTRIVATASA